MAYHQPPRAWRKRRPARLRSFPNSWPAAGRPLRIGAVAGALLYTKDTFVLHFVMKRIACHESGPTGALDHEYTGWAALDQFCGEFARYLGEDRLSPAVLRAS